MVIWAVGALPFKDNFWTSPDQPGNPYHGKEPNPDMQALVSTLSAGPVALSDRIGYTNATVVMQTCAADGTLLKPDKPATSLDVTFLANGGVQGELWSTHSSLPTANSSAPFLTFYYVFAVLDAPFRLLPQHLGIQDVGNQKWVIYEWNSIRPDNPNSMDSIQPFSASQPLNIPPSATNPTTGVIDFHYYRAAPVLSNGWIVLGEWNKFVPLSTQRFLQIKTMLSSVQVLAQGAFQETVSMAFVSPQSQNVIFLECATPDSALILVTCVMTTCECHA